MTTKKKDITDEELIKKEKEERDKKERKRNIILIIIFLFLLFMSSFGITYSMYKGDSGNNNQIITDKIVFTYSDVDRMGSGIDIYNALPISDVIGKKLTGKGEYFDFSITATSKSRDIKYQLLVRKNPMSTISNNNIRIYLVGLDGNYEKELVLSNFDKLKTTVVNNIEYYILYEKVLNKGIKDYSDYYRLRMWINEGAVDYQEKLFSINVDVSAVQVGD